MIYVLPAKQETKPAFSTTVSPSPSINTGTSASLRCSTVTTGTLQIMHILRLAAMGCGDTSMTSTSEGQGLSYVKPVKEKAVEMAVWKCWDPQRLCLWLRRLWGAAGLPMGLRGTHLGHPH